jgi:hypothetical protein
MTGLSRPASPDDRKRLLSALQDERAEYLLIGGYALAKIGQH